MKNHEGRGSDPLAPRPPPGGRGAADALARSVAAEFEVALGRPEKVASDCARLRELLSSAPAGESLDLLAGLAALLRLRVGSIAAPVHALLEDAARACADPWRLLPGMLDARDEELARRALALTAELAECGRLKVGAEQFRFFADRTEVEGGPLSGRDALGGIARIVRSAAGGQGAGEAFLLALCVGGEDARTRSLAARLLDLDGEPAAGVTAKSLLGAEACGALEPHLAYTRASHTDLLHLAGSPEALPVVVASLRSAEAECGEALTREIVAALGWPRMNLGLEVRRFVGVSIGDSIPFFVRPGEAALLEGCEGARRVSETCLIVAHGGTADGTPAGASVEDPVTRFRAYNVTHAELLNDILDVAPLTREKVLRILGRMDRIVGEFTRLFASHTEESALLPDLYRDLRGRILTEMDREEAEPHLSAELTRLVQMFEDPGSLAEVRSLHGLKRYLHQRGLSLGFRLVGAGGGTNRTVSLLAVMRRRIVREVSAIAYVDFEPDPEAAGPLGIPHPVALAVEGFARQLLHGQEAFPGIRIFCYGNEVHYFIAWRNHPAFLRIDFAPPARGGMIDLEYYGVSKYELSAHPNPSLDAVREVFRRLDFDVGIDATRIHARYDKERAIEASEIVERAGALFGLVPYLMDLDWIIGSLALPPDARRRVADAWAEAFVLWGALPIRQILTEDRQGILKGVAAGSTGDVEVRWRGEGPYSDRFGPPPPAAALASLRGPLADLDPDLASLLEEDAGRLVGQVDLERRLLRPIREGVGRGEFVETPDRLRRAAADRFSREHEADAFTEILAEGGERLAAAARLATLVAPLERTVRFRTTGAVNGWEVQRATLAIGGRRIGLYVLRGSGGIAELAFYDRDGVLFRRRREGGAVWESNASFEAPALGAILRRAGHLPTEEAAGPPPREDPEAIRDRLGAQNPQIRPKLLAGERVVQGLRASPGRAVGIARLGLEGRRPDEFADSILVAPILRPEDTTFLYRADGVVSTGGGILSHAGLIATQFRKPALVISGRWEGGGATGLSLLYRTLEYEEEEREVRGWRVSVRREIREREHRLRDRDLVVLDADEGTLRVLGRDRDALALHESLYQFGEASRRLPHASDERDVLVLRGRLVRTRHQAAKVIVRLEDPALARYAVHELLMGEELEAGAAAREERVRLLSLLLANPRVGKAARDHVVRLEAILGRRHAALAAEAARMIPSADPGEVLILRLGLIHARRTWEGAVQCLRECGVETEQVGGAPAFEVDRTARRRLEEIRADLFREAAAGAPEHGIDVRLRHLLRQIERLDRVLGVAGPGSELLERMAAALARRDAAALERCRSRRVLAQEDGGFEIFPLLGWKAANLSEVVRIAGPGLVPPWFVVTDRAFQEVMDGRLGRVPADLEELVPEGATLREAIAAVLSRPGTTDRARSAGIRALWEGLRLPADLASEIVGAYRRLIEATPPEPGGAHAPYVAIRSSAREEDAEAAARAGEFETYLFIQGEGPLLDHIKRAWSGLWTERAIHNRAVLGRPDDDAGGGVIVQRIVESRVSGVLQTANVAEGTAGEIVVNAGLGLGEGVVSGAVAADTIAVSKVGDLEKGPLRFRYVTSEKREQVIFDRRAGFGTVRAETKYHQRLRPALEYVELWDLVRTATRLERGYGYHLDIEFGIEGTHVWILQARPVPILLPVLRETIERYPLRSGERADFEPSPPETMT